MKRENSGYFYKSIELMRNILFPIHMIDNREENDCNNI